MKDAGPLFRLSLANAYAQGYRIAGSILCLYFMLLVPWRMGWIGSSHSPSRPTFLIWETVVLILVCLLVALLAPRRPNFLGHLENWGLLLTAAGLINNTTLLVLTKDPDQAANYMLIMVVTGFVFRSRWRLILAQSLSFLLWAVGTWVLVGPAPFQNWLFAVIAALFLGLILHVFMDRMLKAIELLRERDQIHLHQRAKLIAELRQALDNMKTLRGLIPICAQCKKVRNDEGYWQQVESYLLEHSEAEFTHGLCPHCTHNLQEEFERCVPEEESQD